MLHASPALDGREIEVLDEIDALMVSAATYLREPRRWTGSLRRDAFARVVQGSNTIEGYDVALDDAVAIDLGEEPFDAVGSTRDAVAGYRDAMTYVLQLATDADFAYNETLLKSLHFMMTRHDLSANPGRWRPGSIWIRNEETGGIVYEGPGAEQVSGLTHELVGALATDDGGHPVVRAAMAHLNLVLVHPFSDGNGRMSRCLQTLVLAREGVVFPEFCSIEEYLGRNTSAYYAVLGEVGGGGWHPDRDARPWIRFCLTAHLRQARTTLRRIRESERLWLDIERVVVGDGLPPRTIDALHTAAMGSRVRNSTYRAIGAGEISDQAAGRDLRLLVDRGLLVAVGEKRGRHYVASERLASMWERIVDARDPRDDTDPFAAR